MFYLDTFTEILKLGIGVSQADNRRMFELLSRHLPLTLHRFPSGHEHNGWVVPHDWLVKDALIRRCGEVVFDGSVNPLAVVGYAPSFNGVLSKGELATHIFTRPDLPGAYPFHCMNNYRPWARDWGFCVPHEQWVAWPEGNYEVTLNTEYRSGEMLVAEYHHAGASTDTIVFNAHTCHPCQFNDDLAGVAVIMALMEQLSRRATRYSYKAIFAPEHLGTVFYVAGLNDAQLDTLKGGCFVEMVGIDRPFALQRTFTGRTLLDRVAEHVGRHRHPDFIVGDFRTIVGNDETVWEAPGIEIPFLSLSRCSTPGYYPQYHTDHDNLDITSVQRLTEALEYLLDIIDVLERDVTITRRFRGLVALSNPKYDLYVERTDPTIDKHLSEDLIRLGKAQDLIQRYFDSKHSAFEIAELLNLPFRVVRNYIERFADKSLVAVDDKLHFGCRRH